jgi:hypothetical protein
VVTSIHYFVSSMISSQRAPTYGEEDTKPIFSGGNKTFESIKCVAVVKSVNSSLLISQTSMTVGTELTPKTTIAMRSALAGTVVAILSLYLNECL